jgi:hypothetical protein
MYNRKVTRGKPKTKNDTCFYKDIYNKYTNTETYCSYT